MKRYKEIRQWLYLDCANNTMSNMFFNLAYVLAILNGTPETTLFYQQETNALSFQQLPKIIKKAGAKITLVPVNDIEFIKDVNGNILDQYSNSLSDEKIQVLKSSELAKTIHYMDGTKSKQQPMSDYPFRYSTFGEIVRKSDHQVFIDIAKTRFDIEGRGYPSGNAIRPIKSNFSPSIDVLRQKAKKLAKSGQIIRINSSEIDFGDREHLPTGASIYISRELHDELFNYYVSGQKYDLKNRIRSIDSLVQSTPKIEDYAVHNKAGIFDIDSTSMEAYDKKIRRNIKNIAKRAKETIQSSWDVENHVKHEMIDAQRRLSAIKQIISDNENKGNTINSALAQQIYNLANQY